MNNHHNSLYMHRIHLEIPKLIDFMKSRSLSDAYGNIDLSYGIHCTLRELFGEMAPQPFHLLGCFGTNCELLGYSNFDAASLNQHASTFADPLLFNILDWKNYTAKKMPERILVGSRLSFEVRVCPVKRSRNTSVLDNKAQGVLREYDAFLTFKNAGVSREHVYCGWLAKILEEHGGVNVLQSRLLRFTLNSNNMQRRDRQRLVANLGTRPDATISGLIEVTDESSFQSILAKGIGRHKAFGFGMLLLKPPQ